MTVVMARGVADHIRRHGEEEYPHECCGFLFGTLVDDTQQIVEARRQSNARTESREIRFLITPEDFRQAEKYARQSGRQMLGIYHSHPDDAARPSEYDRDHAWPWYSYLIIAVSRGTAGDLNAWQLKDDRAGFSPVKIGEREE